MRRSMLLLPLSLVVLAGGCDRRSPPQGQGKAGNKIETVADASAISPDEVRPGSGTPALGGVAGIDRSHAGTPPPAFAFQDASGRTTTLAAFKGKPVLLNLWATWCGPCVKELPTLDALAQRNAATLTVVALSQDLDAGKAAPFLAERHLAHLGAYTDAAMRWLPAVTASLPTSILYGADGKERWRVLGPREWTDAETAKALAAG